MTERRLTRREFLAASATLAAGAVACRAAPPATRAVPSHVPSLAEWLGHPATTPLLIVHADDVGIARAENAATIEAFDRGAITSASVMIPCPYAAEFAAWARGRPRLDIGVHLTLTSQENVRWAPVAGAARVPSLVDANGMFPVRFDASRPMDVRELEIEIRAQVARARELGFDLTHLDGHQHIVQLRSAEAFGALARVSRDERLPFRFPRAWLKRAPWGASTFGTLTVPEERMIAIGPRDATDDRWTDWYAAQVSAIPAGMSELFVHVGKPDDELRHVVPDTAHWGSAWRGRDLAAVESPELARAVREVGAVRIGWRAVKDYLLAVG